MFILFSTVYIESICVLSLFYSRSDVEFFTDSNRPDRYSIYQDCYSPQYEQVREFLMQRIDLLIQETSLKTSTHK